ncbi:MAG TPA: MXAN_2562 family outer membrane beta-barrel protein [Polyangiales bacterium]|nr:MXAN_2562 family outer membrane beta-barrel protein [Polyangiales bacterium]
MLRLLIVALACLSASAASARAPDTFEEDYHPPLEVDSPMWMGLELRVGPYRPGNSRAFGNYFENDRGWMLNVEFDVTLYHIPYVGQLNAAFNWGWSNYDARARLPGGGTSDEKTEFTVYPIGLLGVLRIDALARHTVVPLTFAGKLGYELVRWKAVTGDVTERDGLNKGLRWGAQAAFELDWFDRGTARRMDEDWGVNHTYLLFEWYESKSKGVGDSTFTFGLGAQF